MRDSEVRPEKVLPLQTLGTVESAVIGFMLTLLCKQMTEESFVEWTRRTWDALVRTTGVQPQDSPSDLMIFPLSQRVLGYTVRFQIVFCIDASFSGQFSKQHPDYPPRVELLPP